MARMESQKSEVGFRGGSASGRVFTGALLLAGLLLPLAGCGASKVDAIQIAPTSQSVLPGGTAQFTASGAVGHGAHPSTTQDVTSQVAWSSSAPTVATVSASGLATGVSNGTSIITATLQGFTGTITSTATLTVGSGGSGSGGSGSGGSGSGGSGSSGGSQEPLLSINVVPSGVTVSNKGMTAQYLAFGTYSTAPTMRDITNQVTWVSLLPEIASINSYGAPGAAGSGGSSGERGGLATAQGYTGDSDIYAEATNPDGTVVLSNSQTFSCKDPTTGFCDQVVATPQFATITVFIEGENTSPTGEYVTAPSDTGTADLIACGPDWTGSGGQVCTGTYEVGSTVRLLENLPAGSSYFGGWSTGSGCSETNLATTTTCTVTLNGNASVGVIFY